jgi:hypothetical protein
MVSVKPKKSWKLPFIVIVAGLVVCLLMVVTILMVFGDHHDRPNLLNLTFAGNDVPSYDQLIATTSVLNNRFNALGIDASASPLRDNNGRSIIYVRYGNVSADRITAIATMPGNFEMRIQTSDNQSEHILYDGEVKSASISLHDGQTSASVPWVVSMALSSTGAEAFRQACIAHNVTSDQENHPIIMLLDGNIVYSAPLSRELVDVIANRTIDSLVMSAGLGDEGRELAEKVCASISGGELPVPLEVSGT